MYITVAAWVTRAPNPNLSVPSLEIVNILYIIALVLNVLFLMFLRSGIHFAATADTDRGN
jgi:hypothetical protein